MDGSDLRIRDARTGDADHVARLFEAVGGDLKPSDARLPEALAGYLREGTVLVAEASGTVVGACCFFIRRFGPTDAAPLCWIDALAVEEPHRRLGAATAMLLVVRARAEGAGCGSIVLHTHEEMEGALGLYDRLGFERHGLFLQWRLT